MMFDLEVSARSDRGRIRQNNEDMLLVNDRCVRDDVCVTTIRMEQDGRAILAVADGLGGHASGEIASEMAIRSLSHFFSALPSGLTVRDLRREFQEWLECIHREVNTDGRKDVAHLNGMGTTLVALFFYEGMVFWINCGDSRLYRFRGQVLSRVSTDHSLREVTGRMCESHIIVNCIGAGAANCYIDFMDITDCVFDGDRFMLCSDGLSDMCTDEELEGLLCNGSDAGKLVDTALAEGGKDNISVVLAEVRKYEFLEGKEIEDYAINVTRQITGN